MRKIHEVLRLKWQCGLTHRQIAASCSIGAGTVCDYVRRARNAGLAWPLPEGLSEAELMQQLFPLPVTTAGQSRPLPDWAQVQHELKHKGVTLVLLWEEYRARSPDGYGYSRYCELYEAWQGVAEPRMHQVHKAGEKLFVDYTGQTAPVVDRKTGEVHQAQVFVATLGASNYTFVDATWTQSMPDWIGSHVRAFEHFGGVPELLVPDNLKAGVTSPCFYEPDINLTYLDLARHYGVAVIPARVRKPRDKAKVENGVLQAERRILAVLRNRTFFDLAELNEAIARGLDALNRRVCPGQLASRLELFEKLDKPALGPLPAQPYEFALLERGRVQMNYHICADFHWYSVPYRFVNEEVEVRITAAIVEFFHSGERIASHLHSYQKGGYTTLAEHMPPSHRYLLECTPEQLVDRASKRGPATVAVIQGVLSSRSHPQQALRSGLGILHLSKKFGDGRLEAACHRALAGKTLTYRSIRAILANNLDQAPLPRDGGMAQRDATASNSGTILTTPIRHANIRGPEYYTSSTSEDGVPDA
jgi:transposase